MLKTIDLVNVTYLGVVISDTGSINNDMKLYIEGKTKQYYFCSKHYLEVRCHI